MLLRSIPSSSQHVMHGPVDIDRASRPNMEL